MALHIKIGEIPQNPGVYTYRNARGIVLYVGKANNLRARLRSYFLKNAPSKARALVQEAASLSWEIVGSEIEALIYEAKLIKKYRPRYNVLMRDDKQYFFVEFTHDTYPKIFITHQMSLHNQKTDFVGPFTDGTSLKTTLKMLRRIFPYCTCKQTHKTPCLNARIGRCLGFCCAQDVSSSSSRSPKTHRFLYIQNILAIKNVLSGKNTTLTRSLRKEMRSLSASQHYEVAAKTRDQIHALERIFAHKSVIRKDMPTDRTNALQALGRILKIIEIKRIEGYDISNIHGHFAYGSMVVFYDGMPKKDDYRIFKIRTVLGSDDPRMIHEMISRRLRHPEWQYPDVMLIDGGPTQLSAALSALGRPTSKLIKVVSLAKREEELFLSPRQISPIKLKQSSESLYAMLTHIRNEAHRFAIKHYRKSHRKTVRS